MFNANCKQRQGSAAAEAERWPPEQVLKGFRVDGITGARTRGTNQEAVSILCRDAGEMPWSRQTNDRTSPLVLPPQRQWERNDWTTFIHTRSQDWTCRRADTQDMDSRQIDRLTRCSTWDKKRTGLAGQTWERGTEADRQRRSNVCIVTVVRATPCSSPSPAYRSVFPPPLLSPLVYCGGTIAVFRQRPSQNLPIEELSSPANPCLLDPQLHHKPPTP